MKCFAATFTEITESLYGKRWTGRTRGCAEKTRGYADPLLNLNMKVNGHEKSGGGMNESNTDI